MVYDDLMAEISHSMMQHVATRMHHHHNFSCLTITQTAFIQGKAALDSVFTESILPADAFLQGLKTGAGLRQSTVSRQKSKGLRYLQRCCWYKNRARIQSHNKPLDEGKVELRKFNDGRRKSHLPRYLFISCNPYKTVSDCQLFTNIFEPGGVIVLYRL